MEFVPEEVLREILLKLPTRDLVPSCCVCRLWRGIVRDPSFRTLHGNARHVVFGSGGEAETLVVPEFRVRVWGVGLQMTILSVSSAKPMCRFSDLAGGYSPANACNGFLLIASGVKDWPLYVCNPVTGEKLQIPAPLKIKRIGWRMYAMGFSPSTLEYKLFRLSFRKEGWQDAHENYLDVYTLGADNSGWRQQPHMFPYHGIDGLYSPPPVFLDGALYIVTTKVEYSRAADWILVIDVASEAQFTYKLPETFAQEVTVGVHTFELCGRLCVAMHIIDHGRVSFWVMPSLQKLLHMEDMEDEFLPCWERRYTFYVEATDEYWNLRQCGTWLDSRHGMLCYRLGDLVYKYDTTKKRPVNDSLDWDDQIQLPPNRFATQDDLQWNVYGGYRPSLLSPHRSRFCLLVVSAAAPRGTRRL